MHMRVFGLVYLIGASLMQADHAAAQEDAYLALQSNAPGAFNYIRLAEVQVFLDASPSRCTIILTDGEEIRAFQKCSPLTDHLRQTGQLQQIGLISFPNSFGSVLLSPSFISNLVSTNNAGCRLNLKNGKFVHVSQPCNAVHKALPLE
jgi:hypothetical protein